MNRFPRAAWLLGLQCLATIAAPPRVWGDSHAEEGAPPSSEAKLISAAPMTPEKIRAVLDEMGVLRIPQELSDPVLVKDLETVARYGQSQAEPQRVLTLLKLTLHDAGQREEETLELARPLLARFTELENQLLLEKTLPKEELVRAIKKYHDNTLFVLVVGYIAVSVFQDEVTPGLVDIFNQTHPGYLKAEWAKLAYQLLRSSRRDKLVPFYMNMLGLQEYELPLEGGAKYSAEEVQLATMIALGATGEKIVLEGLSSPDPLVKRSAARLSGDMMSDRNIDRLAQLLADSGDTSVRILAARSLGTLLSYRHAAALENAAADPNSEVRIAGLRALGELALKRSRSVIFTLLADKNPRVRRAAIDSLDRYVDAEEVVQRLGGITKKDESELIRTRAALVLSRSPLPSASVILGAMLRETAAGSESRRSIEELVKQQSLEVAHGSMIPQFSVVYEDGSALKQGDVPYASAILRKKVREDKAFSASELAGLAPGLGESDLPVIREARELMVQLAKPVQVIAEVDKLNRLMRLIISRRREAA